MLLLLIKKEVTIIKKTLIVLSCLLLFSSIALADYSMMDCAGGYGMMGGLGTFGASLLGLLYFAVAAFVFSLIFWLTHNLLVKDKKKAGVR